MSKKQAFILTSTAHGTMIVPRFDYKQKSDGSYELGVGSCLLEFGDYELDGVSVMAAILEYKRQKSGDGVVMVDGGANLGAFSLSLGRHMTGWGQVLAFEPQDRIFMALCGNICLNNLFNVHTYRAALARKDASIKFPIPDYTVPGQFGGVNALGQADIGQKFTQFMEVPSKRVDSLKLKRLDFLKLDIEGMEIEALVGSMETLTRCKPIVWAEHIKCGRDELENFFSKIGYKTTQIGGMDILAAYKDDEFLNKISSPTTGEQEIVQGLVA